MDFGVLDAFTNLVQTYPVMPSWMKQVVDELALLKALLMDPPIVFIEDATRQTFESLAMEVESIISVFYHQTVENNSMVLELCKELKNPLRRLWFLTNIARIHYDKFEHLKPSRNDFPTTDRLGFVGHLVENLEELVKVKADVIGPLKPYILRLQQKLQFLSSQLMKIPDQRKEEADVKDLIVRITNLAYEVEFVIDSFLVRDIPILYCMFWVGDIITEINRTKRLVMIDTGDMRSIIKSILPKVPVKFNIIPIVNNNEINGRLGEVFNTHAIIVHFYVRTWSLVSSYEERKREVFQKLVDNVAYKTPLHNFQGLVLENCTGDTSQDGLESLVCLLLKKEKYFIILEDVGNIEAFNDIRRVLPNHHNGSTILLTTPSPELAVQCRYGSQESVSRNVSGIHCSASQTNKPAAVDDIVGFEGETERMLERLVRGKKKLSIISIFGMPGQGKTTLATKLYNDLSIVGYFDIRVWCCVSQVYKRREVLLELVGQLDQDPETIHHRNDEDLAELLYRNIRGRRFLVVLDDMWSTGAWNDLKRCFPNDNNGSRIIFITRLIELASQAQSGSMLLPLGPLSDDESWALLEKKLFDKESCPPKLLVVGRQIAKNCKGLPLSVTLTAGFLSKMEKNVDQWRLVLEKQSLRILDEEAGGKGIIELSYKHLPDYLKPCFLYCGAFLDDRKIPVQKLIRLWVAEGFVKQLTGSKSLEELAKGYLADLVARSLIIVAERKSNGGVKSCRMHDLLRDFCLVKAREENFMQMISTYDELFPSYYGLDPNYSFGLRSITNNLRRFCIYSKGSHFTLLKPFGPFVRSLLLFVASDVSPIHSDDISFIFHNFKLLKILDLGDINTGYSLKSVDVLIHLRYLAIQGYVDPIPSSIVNMWNLETFLVKELETKVVQVPDSIWDMAKLRHVHINGSAYFNLEPRRLENSSMLNNLQTLSTPIIAYGDDMEKILRRLSGIRKLKCIFQDSWDDTRNCNQFAALEVLNQLVSLNVLYCGMGIYPCKFYFPSNLRKLTLSSFRMPWNELSQLVILCNLEVLKLVDNAFEGEIWDMQDDVFPKLRFLKLDTLNVGIWSASSDNFPCLEHLVLNKCKQLEEIPPGIGDVYTLGLVEVLWCSTALATSAGKIQAEQLEYGNQGLKINVHPKVWDTNRHHEVTE